MAAERSDEDLLADSLEDSKAFAAFYRRHARPLTAFFLRRTGSAEMAADLTAETFAAALAGRRRYLRARGPAAAWLYGIARHKLADALEHGHVEMRARRRMGMPRLELDDEQLEQVEAAADGSTLRALDSLPPEQRAAVEARVVQERSYREIARQAGTSELVIRQRVSRGLAALRARIGQGGL